MHIRVSFVDFGRQFLIQKEIIKKDIGNVSHLMIGQIITFFVTLAN
jgi:hypothetical protein